MTLSYRAGTPADAAAVAALFHSCFTETFGALYAPDDLALFLDRKNVAHFREELADPAYAFRLAEEEGTLTGYLKLGPPCLPVETPPDSIELHHLYVLAPWQGAGVAAVLTDWAIDEAQRRGGHHLQLSVYIDNHRARRFYERRGFVAVGDYRFMVGNHADHDLVLRRPL